ncbi:MAG: DMT family transporter [Chloroflexi bacterium]|nr:MAG: DMT family transporter [Chloroflexota bacterium]
MKAEEQPGTTLGLLLVLVSATGYGSQAIFARLAYSAGANVSTVLLLRFLLAVAVLWGALAVTRRIKFAWHIIRSRGRLLGLFALGAVFSGNAAAYFSALTYLHVAVVALLFYLYPAIVLIFSAVFLHERLGILKLTALMLAVSGSALTVGPPGSVALPGVGGGHIALGLVLALGAAVVYAIYIVLGNHLTAGIPSDVAAAVSMTGTAIVFGLGALAGDGATLRVSASAGASIAAIALFSTVIATSLFLAGLERLGPSKTAIVATVEPVVTLVLATVVLHEPPAWFQTIGAALILAAVMLAQRAPRVVPAVQE